MGLTAAGEVRAIDGLLLNVYISLHTGDPTLGGNEIVGGAYARQAYAYSKTGSNPTQAANNAIIQYPAATTLWGEITHVGIWTALAAGTLLAEEALDTPKIIDVDDVFRFPTSNLKVLAD